MAPPAPAQTLTRDDLGRLSHSASPWVFLPIIDRAIAQAPGDLGLALLGVRTLAALGLRTPAIERLEALGPALDSAPGAEEIRRAVAALPADVVPLTRRLKMADRNIAALAGRGVDLRDEFASWSEGEPDWEHLRALGGNVVRRPAGSPCSQDWLWVGDLRAGMERFVAGAFGELETARTPPIAVEGVNPPWLLLAVYAHTPPTALGFSTRLRVVQRDLGEFFEGLTVADCRACLGDTRTTVCLGDDAGGMFKRSAASMMDHQQCAGGVSMTALTVRTRVEPSLESICWEITESQVRLGAQLAKRVASVYRGRDAAWWSARYAQAQRPEPALPLRVLVYSCRYTTYVQHAAASLVAALRRRGCVVHEEIEPDHHSGLTKVGTLRAFESLEPDLVIAINYTRHQGCDSAPAEVPFVSWAQDGMPHYFDPENGGRYGAMDFFIGHVFEDLLTGAGIGADHALRLPVVADAEIFKPTEFSIGLPQRFDTEIAYVSHHSEAPDAMLERLVNETGGGQTEPMLRRIAGRVGDLLRDAGSGAFRRPLRRAVETEVERTCPGHERGDIAARVFHQFAIPLAERIIRHEMIRWASGAAARRGWRLALYGKGWDEHPEYCDLARGPMEHGAALRDCYERSVVHLHASVCNPAHQRVQECALSGGLPLSRITRDALQVEYEIMRLGAMGRIEPSMPDEAEGLVGFRIADDPDLLAIAALLQRLGMSMEPGGDDSLLWIDRSDWERREAATAIPTIDTRTRWLFGDYSQCAFTDEAGLEQLVERAIERPAWRKEVIGGIAGRVRERLTIDAAARRLIEFVSDGVNDAARAGSSNNGA